MALQGLYQYRTVTSTQPWRFGLMSRASQAIQILLQALVPGKGGLPLWPFSGTDLDPFGELHLRSDGVLYRLDSFAVGIIYIKTQNLTQRRKKLKTASPYSFGVSHLFSPIHLLAPFFQIHTGTGWVSPPPYPDSYTRQLITDSNRTKIYFKIKDQQLQTR